MSHQHEFKNTVASSGTALTVDHLKIFKRYANNLVLAFDMDIAGDLATKRAINLTIESGFNVKIIPGSSEKKEKVDPADILRADSKKWKKIIDNATGIIEFYFNNTLAKFDQNTVNGKKEIARVLLPILKRIPDKIEQNYWVQELATKLKTSEKVIIDAIKSIPEEKDFKVKKIAAPLLANKSKNRLENLEEEIIGLILLAPDLEITDEIKKAGIKFINPQLNLIFADFIKHFKKNSDKTEASLKKWRAALPAELNLLIEQILFKLEIQHADIDNFSKHLHNCLKEFKKEKVWHQMGILRLEIKECEKNKDKKGLNNHLENFKQLASQLNE
jgi:DNA primase